MGLDCSHDAWSGGYGAFHVWRSKIAEVAGLPPLELMEGFYNRLDSRSDVPSLYFGQTADVWEEKAKALDDLLPISWGCLEPSPLHKLLFHSDCDGDISAENCESIAEELEKLLPDLPEDGPRWKWRKMTERFAKGLRAASEAGEPLEFM